MRLGDFILANIEPILMEWELFARGIWPGGAADPVTLRDDAEAILLATVLDMKSAQTAAQQADKSRGKCGGESHSLGIDQTSATHGVGRMDSGFDLAAVIAEYRALRASVIRLWRQSDPNPGLSDLEDLTRFNESIDQSLTEAVLAFTTLVKRDRNSVLEAEARQAQELRSVNEALLVSSVHQHELTEQANNANERELTDFFDNASIGMHWAGPDGTILRANQAELNLLGLGAPGGEDQYIGHNIAEYHVDQPVIEEILARLTRGQTLRDYPARLRHKDGSIRHVLINASVLFEKGQFIHTRCFTHDITDRKRAEEEMRHARQQAEDASHAKDKFLAVLSHELRTPLTPVLLAAAALEARDDLAPALHEQMAMIRRNVELQSRLIDDLLDLSRIISGKLSLNFDNLQINDLVGHACDICRPNLRARGINLYCDMDADAFDVAGDGARLEQVFWNLLNNATKFTPPNGQVIVRSENIETAEGPRVRVTVRDTGIGIAPQALERIFAAFEQAEPGQVAIARQFGGMGLGLAICRALVEQHHGTIRAHSEGKDKGSTFVVELPAAPRRAEAPLTSLPSVPEKLRSLRMLLVEDHSDTIEILTRLLTAEGHTVETATTAAGAIKLAGDHKFDIIVSDLGLPDMTGYDLMRQIKLRNSAKGIAMSGYGMEEDIRQSQQAGFSDHLVKPVSLEKLQQSIRRVIINGQPDSPTTAMTGDFNVATGATLSGKKPN